MKITVNKKELETAINLTAEVVSKKSINPILQNVLLKAENNELEIAATDLEVSLIIRIPAQIEKPGKVTVLNSLFSSIVKSIPTEEIAITESSQSTVDVNSIGGAYHVTLRTIPADEFPAITLSELSGAPSFMIKGFALKEMITKNIPFAAKDEVRYTFHTIYFEKENMDFKTIASDTKRLAVARTMIESNAENFNMLIPIKSGKIVKDMIGEEDVEIRLLNKKTAFLYKNVVLITNQIEGKFPDYRAVIPKETVYNILVPKTPFEKLIKSLAPFLTGEVQKLMISFNDNKITARTEETEQGKGENSIFIDYKDKPIEIAFSYKFLVDIISVIDEDEMWIKIFDPDKPILFVGKDNANYLFVTVPMKK